MNVEQENELLRKNIKDLQGQLRNANIKIKNGVMSLVYRLVMNIFNMNQKLNTNRLHGTDRLISG